MIKVTIVDDLLKVDIDTETSTVDIPSVTPSANVVNVPDFTTKVVSPQYAVTLKQYGIQSQPILFAAALEKQLAEIMAIGETLVFNAQPDFLEALGLIEDLAKNASTQLSETMAMTEEVTFMRGLNLEEATLMEEVFDRVFTALVSLTDNMSLQETEFVLSAIAQLSDATLITEALMLDSSVALSDDMLMTEALALSFTDVIEEALAVVEDVALTPTVVLPTEIMSLSELDFYIGYFAGVNLQDDLALTESILFGVSLDYIEQTTLVEIPVLTFSTTLIENNVTASEVFAITPNIIYTDTIVSSEGLTMYLQDYVQDYLPIDYVGQLYQY